jgi:hypothetical protein
MYLIVRYVCGKARDVVEKDIKKKEDADTLADLHNEDCFNPDIIYSVVKRRTAEEVYPYLFKTASNEGQS